MCINRPAAYYAMKSVDAGRTAIWYEDRQGSAVANDEKASAFWSLAISYLVDALRIVGDLS